jgi:hypothetical protein
MSVFREVEIAHNGETFVFVPSNRLLRRIEGQGISLPSMVSRIGKGQPPVSEIAYVICEFLREGGARGVDEDGIYLDMMDDLQNNGGKGFASMCVAIVNAITPVDPDEKKRAAPVSKPQAKAGAKRQK